MKKLLVLFTIGFPYSDKEPFLNPEFPQYKQYYDHVLIVAPRKAGDRITRILDSNFFSIIDDYSHFGSVSSTLSGFFLALTDHQLYREVWSLIKKGKLSLQRLYDLVIQTACGNHRSWEAAKWIKKHTEFNSITAYSYWFNTTAYSAVKLKQNVNKNIFAVSRAHGFDLYEERYKTKYPPNQHFIFQNVDYIATISEDGKRYLETKYGGANKIHVWHLGAIDKRKLNPVAGRDVLRIVSCSRVVPVKRVHRILESLMGLSDARIIWTHLGGGDLLEEIKKRAESLPSNITVEFTGNIPNEEIYEKYTKTPFHVFINTSESEGISVAIMEAMSFGIPVIATDVGGTRELVFENENGFILSPDFSNDDFINVIKRYISMSEDEYLMQRQMARRRYSEAFNAEENAANFLTAISTRSSEYKR